MAITIRTLVTEIRAAVNDTDTDTSQQWLSDTQYEGFLLRNVCGSETTIAVSKCGTGRFANNTGGCPVALWLNSSTPFTETSGVSSTVHELGPVIKITAGTQTGDSISLTGTPVDFNEACAQVYEYLANHKSQEIAKSYADASITPSGVARELNAAAARLRASYGV